MLDQHGGKGAPKLKTRVLDALGLQKGPLLSDSGRCLGSLAIAFSPCLSRKRLFQGTLGMLAIAFPPCLSRKRLFQSPPERPKSGPFRTILIASFGPSRRPFPPQGEGKGKVHATFASSRLPFAPTCRGKGDFKPPLRYPPEVSFRMILDAGFDPSRLPLPP